MLSTKINRKLTTILPFFITFFKTDVMFSLLESPIMDRFLWIFVLYIVYYVAVCGAIMVCVTVKLLELCHIHYPIPLINAFHVSTRKWTTFDRVVLDGWLWCLLWGLWVCPTWCNIRNVSLILPCCANPIWLPTIYTKFVKMFTY